MESYSDFYGLLTGYRGSLLLLLAADLNISTLICGGISISSLLDNLDIHRESGRRLLKAFEETGLLEQSGETLSLTPFSAKYLHPSSSFNQLNTLKMEKRIMEKWMNLPEFMKKGEHSKIKVKSSIEYLEDLKIFLGSMNEAARIRCTELWDIFDNLPEKGTIIDFGAGSGAALEIFLTRHEKWSGVFCDLKDVVKEAQKRESLRKSDNRILFIEMNLLDNAPLPSDIPKGDILLYSNFLHCQSQSENSHILRKTLKYLNPGGKAVIHDFIPGLSPSGYLYDIHMMVNTYNGRTYSDIELEELFKENSFSVFNKETLPSGSGCFTAEKESAFS